MYWYAASIVVSVEFIDGNQDQFPIWENVVLINASTDEEALMKAALIGKESDGDEFVWEGRPAFWKYHGTRKLLLIDSGDDHISMPDGQEVTFSQMLLKSRSDLDRFVEGEEVDVIYEK